MLHGAPLGFLTNVSSESGQVIGSLWISWHGVCDLVILSARTETKLTDWQRNVHGDAKLMIETLLYNGIQPLARGGRLVSLSYFTLHRLVPDDPCTKKTT